MSFRDDIFELSDKIKRIKNHTKSEEGTKKYLIDPFLELLDYNTNDPLEVDLEFGTSEWKSEKVDYALKLNRNPIMILESKHWTEKLFQHKKQLKHYYNGLNVPYGILTNGIHYQFYSDLDRMNIMDDTPFLEFDFEDIDESKIGDVALFRKNSFDEDKIRQRAQDLRYGDKIKRILSEEIQNPSDEFIRFVVRKFYQKTLSKKVVDKFKPAVINAFNELIDGRLSIKLAQSEHLKKAKKRHERGLSEQPKKEPRRAIIRASFSDGTVYCHPKAVDTYIDVINKIGIRKVRSLGIEKSFTPLIWDQKHPQYNQRQIQPNCYVFTNLSTRDKIKTLEQIVSRLGIHVKLEEVRE